MDDISTKDNHQLVIFTNSASIFWASDLSMHPAFLLPYHVARFQQQSTKLKPCFTPKYREAKITVAAEVHRQIHQKSQGTLDSPARNRQNFQTYMFGIFGSKDSLNNRHPFYQRALRRSSGRGSGDFNFHFLFGYGFGST